MKTTKTALPLAALLILAAATASLAAAAGPQSLPDPARAAAAFERLRQLEGAWIGSSTRGWEEQVTYRVLAKGSAVLSTSYFRDNPEENMATIYHMDGDRLMLTHYCEAGNQPRMVATRISPDGREIDFTFLDATNLASPGAGHMASAVYRFHDDGTFTSRWSFHKEGEEVWAEDIRHQRRAADGKAPGSP